jgi:hypothetical protein
VAHDGGGAPGRCAAPAWQSTQAAWAPVAAAAVAWPAWHLAHDAAPRATNGASPWGAWHAAHASPPAWSDVSLGARWQFVHAAMATGRGEPGARRTSGGGCGGWQSTQRAPGALGWWAARSAWQPAQRSAARPTSCGGWHDAHARWEAGAAAGAARSAWQLAHARVAAARKS